MKRNRIYVQPVTHNNPNQHSIDMDKNTDNGIFGSIDQDSGFKVEEKAHNIIKVVGVGGGGNNAINHMYAQNISGVSFVVINTDRQALVNSPVPTRLLIGPETTKGLGAGNNPGVAKEAAEESADDIAALFDDDTKMVFITAGMGGGTGTGAAPVVARIARDKGVLTIGIVTIPFLFEGQKKILKALAGADEMHKYVDALLVINNERLTEIYPDLDFANAFGKADDTLSIAARSISELITTEGKINLDFNDVNTTLRDGGVAIISSGFGEGEHRVTKAIEDALESPLLKNRDVYGSKKILMNFYFSRNASKPFKMSEINEMRAFMTHFGEDVDVIWGVAFDDSLEEKVKITILAAGFEVSLDGDAEGEITKPVGASSNVAAQEPAVSSDEANKKRLLSTYGKSFENQQNALLEARYMVLKPDQMDSDEDIARLETVPTLKRGSKSAATSASGTATSTPRVGVSGDGPKAQDPKKGASKPKINPISF